MQQGASCREQLQRTCDGKPAGSIDQFSITPDHGFQLSANREKRYYRRDIGSYTIRLG